MFIVLALVYWYWDHSDDSLERVRERGELRIGYAIEPPYALLKQDVNRTGFRGGSFA